MSAYLFVDPEYFESIHRYEHTPEFERVLTDVLPEGWTVEREGTWLHASTPWRRYPDQGFKLHVSVTPDDAEAVLRRVAEVCRDESTAFKCAADPRLLAHLNSKRASRGSSGKFMTIYPESHAAFLRLAERVREATEGVEGPYILSDRRVPGSRCVFYRYGGFVRVAKLRPDGQTEAQIRGLDGTPFSDYRRPYFTLPDGVEDPFPPEDEGDDETLLIGGRFEVSEALAFSNTGGVYLATDHATGDEVVLKEARPHTNAWSLQDGYLDGVGLLEHEDAVLRALDGTGVTARPLGLHTAWEHTFLAQSVVPGEPLRTFRARPENALSRTVFDPEAVAAFCETFRAVARGLLDAVEAIHARGVLIGDLSHNNVMVDPDTLEVGIIDLESAHRADDAIAEMARRWYTPGFRPLGEVGRRPVTPADDWYAAGMALYSLVMASQALTRLAPESAPRFMARFVEAGLPAWVRDVVADVVAAEPEAARERLAREAVAA